MTLSEALTLAEEKPDEFEKLVAIKVMGWHVGMTKDEWPHWVSDDDGCQHPRYLSYLTDYNAVMEVVERMRDGPAATRTLQIVAYSYNRTYAVFGHPRTWARGLLEKDPWSEANGENSFQLAVCIAALRALGEVTA